MSEEEQMRSEKVQSFLDRRSDNRGPTAELVATHFDPSMLPSPSSSPAHSHPITGDPGRSPIAAIPLDLLARVGPQSAFLGSLGGPFSALSASNRRVTASHSTPTRA